MMANIWTENEIEEILIQLEQRGLPFKRYKFTRSDGRLNILGHGGFAIVYEAESTSKRKEKYAIKVIGFGDKHIDYDSFYNEITLQNKLGNTHKNTIKIYNQAEVLLLFDDENNIVDVKDGTHESKDTLNRNVLKLQFILMEKSQPVISFDDTGKKHLINDRLSLEYDESEILKLALDVGNVILDAHKINIFHRDIKLENVFYSHKKKCYQLGDFGIAKIADNGMASTVTFTKGYGAPEIIGRYDNKYDCTADIYSFGMLLYVLMNGMKFPDSDNYNVNISTQYKEGYVLPDPENGSEELKRIVLKMCMFNPDDRYQSMDNVIQDLDCIMYEDYAVRYQKKHNETSLFLGGLFWLFGFGLLTADNDIVIDYESSLMFYLLIALGIVKAGFYLFRKKENIINIFIILVGIGYMITDGFTFSRMISVGIFLLSKGYIEGIATGTIATYYLVRLLQNNGFVSMSNHVTIFSLAIALISMAIVFLLQFLLIFFEDKRCYYNLYSNTNMRAFMLELYYKYNVLWIGICLVYFLVLLIGIKPSLIRNLMTMLNIDIKVISCLLSINMSLIGGVGLIFSIFWIIRQKICYKYRF